MGRCQEKKTLKWKKINLELHDNEKIHTVSSKTKWT